MIGNTFGAQYNGKKVLNMQYISLTKKSIYWFMNDIVVKNRDTGRTADFSPLVNLKVPSNTRKLVGIVHTFVKKYEKPYLLFNCECLDVDSLEYFTWVIKMQSFINYT